MNNSKYNDYNDAFEHENIKLIIKQQEELEKRMKLEESLNILAMFAVIGIILALVVVALLIFGVISIGSATSTEIVGGFLNRLL